MSKTKKSDFFKTNDPLFGYSVDMLLIGVCLLIIGTFLNGITAVFQAAVCTVTATVSEYASFKLVTKSNPLGDLSALSTGLMISLLLPACAPLWVGAIASAFAVLVVRLPFGGTRNAPFVPAAAGISFVSICFPALMSVYPAASCGMNAVFSNAENFNEGVTLLDMLSSGTNVKLNIFGVTSLLSGTFPGAIGSTCILALLGVTVYLIINRPSRLWSSLGCIASAALFAAVFPRVNSGFISSIVLEICAGSFLFAALLLANDPVTSPKKPLASFLYGALTGIICMLLRRFAKIEDNGCFAVMIINALWPVLSRRTATDHAFSVNSSPLKTASKLDKSAARKVRKKSADAEKPNASETTNAAVGGGDKQ